MSGESAGDATGGRSQSTKIVMCPHEKSEKSELNGVPAGGAAQLCVPPGPGDTWGGSQPTLGPQQRLNGRHRRTHKQVKHGNGLCEPSDGSFSIGCEQRFLSSATERVLAAGHQQKRIKL